MQVETLDLDLKAVLTTHHHDDHDGGNREIKSLSSSTIIYGSDDRVASLDVLVQPEEKIQVRLFSCLFFVAHVPICALQRFSLRTEWSPVFCNALLY